MFGKRKSDVHAGISSPDCRQEVSPRNGGTQSAKDDYGEDKVLYFLETSRQDLFFAVRQLSKNLGFTLTAIVVFALGVAASTVIFAFVDAALVKPLPYRDPSRLVALYERIPVGDRYHISWGDYLDWKRLNRVFISLDVYTSDLLTLKSVSSVEEVAGVWVSDGFFRTLGVEPFLGRDFRPGEDQPSAQQTVLLSYENWQRRFSASKGVLGQTLTLDGVPSLIIGVLPPGFHFAPVGAADQPADLGRVAFAHQCPRWRWQLGLQDRVCPAVHPQHDGLQFGVLPQRFRPMFATEPTPLAAAERNL